jgi:hypothetical protein
VRWAVVLALVVAGCGSDTGATKPQVAPAPTPPDSEQLKYDLLTAAIQLDSYKLQEHTFTADERKLGPAFPPTVTIKTADATTFYLAAYDNHHIRYALRRTGDVTERTCAPAEADACPGGKW